MGGQFFGGGSSGGGTPGDAPGGAAGGDLSGTYPNPGVAKLNNVAAASYALLAGPTFTGTVTLPASTVTSGMILDGTIVSGDLNAAAGITSGQLAGSIAPSKVTGTAVTAADTGTVTSTMIADATIVSADLSATAGITSGQLAGSIAPSKITGTAVTAADTGTVTSTMITDATIVSGDLAAAAGITNGQLAGSILSGQKILDDNYYLNGSHTYRETMSRRTAVAGVAPAGWTTGTMLNVALVLYAGDVVTNLTFIAAGTGESGGTHCWAALYDTQATPALVTNSQSTDQTGATFFGASATHSFALGAAFTVVTTGVYYASLSVTASTMPTVIGASTGNSITSGAVATGQKVLASVSGSALGASAPGTIASPTTIVAMPYAVTS